MLSLFLPNRCLLCGQLGPLPWCQTCEQRMPNRPRPVARNGLPAGWAGHDYAGQVQTLLHWLKSSGSKKLADQLGRLVRLWLAFLLRATGEPHVVLVPMPSRPSATKKRGFVPAWLLGQAVARAMAQARWPGRVTARRLVWYRRQVARQAKLGSAQRQVNLQWSMLATSAPAGAPPVVLLDDVVTTGATLREAHRALTAAGWRVLGFVTFAETL